MSLLFSKKELANVNIPKSFKTVQLNISTFGGTKKLNQIVNWEKEWKTYDKLTEWTNSLEDGNILIGGLLEPTFTLAKRVVNSKIVQNLQKATEIRAKYYEVTQYTEASNVLALMIDQGASDHELRQELNAAFFYFESLTKQENPIFDAKFFQSVSVFETALQAYYEMHNMAMHLMCHKLNYWTLYSWPM